MKNFWDFWDEKKLAIAILRMLLKDNVSVRDVAEHFGCGIDYVYNLRTRWRDGYQREGLPDFKRPSSAQAINPSSHERARACARAGHPKAYAAATTKLRYTTIDAIYAAVAGEGGA